MIDVAAVAQRMLSALEEYFDERSWDLPARRYVAAGSHRVMAADDEHLAVALVSMSPGASDQGNRVGGSLSRAVGAVMPPRAVLVARIMRCVATVDSRGFVPEAETLNDDGLRLLADPGRMITALMAWREAERTTLNANALTTIGSVEVIGPMGGLAGHAIEITIGPVQ